MKNDVQLLAGGSPNRCASWISINSSAFTSARARRRLLARWIWRKRRMYARSPALLPVAADSATLDTGCGSSEMLLPRQPVPWRGEGQVKHPAGAASRLPAARVPFISGAIVASCQRNGIRAPYSAPDRRRLLMGPINARRGAAQICSSSTVKLQRDVSEGFASFSRRFHSAAAQQWRSDAGQPLSLTGASRRSARRPRGPYPARRRNSPAPTICVSKALRLARVEVAIGNSAFPRGRSGQRPIIASP